MYLMVVIQTLPAGVALDRLARLERLYDGPIPAPLRRWALSGMPPAPPRLQADTGVSDTGAADVEANVGAARLTPDGAPASATDCGAIASRDIDALAPSHRLAAR